MPEIKNQMSMKMISDYPAAMVRICKSPDRWAMRRRVAALQRAKRIAWGCVWLIIAAAVLGLCGRFLGYAGAQVYAYFLTR